MTYSIKIRSSAVTQLARLDVQTCRQIVDHIDGLASNPHVGTVLKGELEGLRRTRVGAYRIVSELRKSELLVLVVRVGHRSSVVRR